MTSQILVPEEEQVKEVIGNNEDGVFVNCRSSFIITDELKVTSNSIGVLMKVLNDQGYAGFSDLKETLIDVGFEEVIHKLLFIYLFCSRFRSCYIYLFLFYFSLSHVCYSS